MTQAKAIYKHMRGLSAGMFGRLLSAQVLRFLLKGVALLQRAPIKSKTLNLPRLPQLLLAVNLAAQEAAISSTCHWALVRSDLADRCASSRPQVLLAVNLAEQEVMDNGTVRFKITDPILENVDRFLNRQVAGIWKYVRSFGSLLRMFSR